MVSKWLMRINCFLFCLFFLLTSNLQAVPYYPGGGIEAYISNKKNSIQNANWLNQIDASQLRYLRSIIEFFWLGDPQNTAFPNTYEKVKTFDRGDFLLGLFSSVGGKHWVVSVHKNYASYNDYKAVVESIIDKINSAKLTYVSSAMDGVAYMIKYNLGVMAGLSSAWQVRPDAKLQHKRMNAEESLKYAFRINQQGLRHALLKHYMEELYEQKKETASFISFVKELCSQGFSIFDRPRSIDEISTVNAGPDFIAGNSIYYNRVLQGMRNLAEFLFEMNQRELTVLCAQASLLAWQSALISVANELTLFELSVIYNILQHFEHFEK